MLDFHDWRAKMSNKSMGNTFEKEFCQVLSGYGFWAHCLKDNHNGQPFDVIVARNRKTFVFDCKECTSERFPLSRIEENQKTAMALWWECGNTEPLFAIRFPFTGIRVLSYSDAMGLLDEGRSAIQGRDVTELTVPLKEWEAWLWR